MGKVDIKMPDEFLERISKVGSDFDSIAETVLETGGEVVFARTKSNLSAVIGKGTKYESRSTGELESALGMTTVKMDKQGNHNIKIGFAEPRSDGDSNAKIANIIEYGKHGQLAKPFLKPAKRASKNECITAMQNKFEEEVDKR
ncbi:HK97 gp10 family phage protein [Enterococcus sp. PF1-24]|uniref:HK97-gp10 family putative phage morphogenesis protein n=1 Tax=unclassified Enterococcus TaxID=2608891 RepID=UPI0024751009|nr:MULTISPECIES: HK97-gp10 family putative phage morphogenesis protein [unclassified Enterococcus]MDH6363101.1 HK97 gp10 family phage protein [Enterococcus sp. PFB1-1]MDH6400195.1 HK97 gp10 family phage protein [Enterococcus sp. PF1-24]